MTAYPHEKLRVTVLSVRSEFETKRLKDIETISETIVPTPDEKERIRAQMQKVTEDMTRSIEPRCLPL